MFLQKCFTIRKLEIKSEAMLKKVLLFPSFLVVFGGLSFGQAEFSANKISPKANQSEDLKKEFRDYQLYSMDVTPLLNYARNAEDKFFSFKLDFGTEKSYNIDLIENDLRTDDYILYSYENGNYIQHERSANITFKGFLNDNANSWVRMTINDGYISGVINDSEETIYFNVLDSKSDGDQMILLYNEKDIKDIKAHNCQYEAMERKVKESSKVNRKAPVCVIAEIYLVADEPAMQTFGGSVANCDAKMLEILNLVNQHYLPIECRHTVKGSFIATGTAPWTVMYDPGDHLQEVIIWADAGGPNQGGSPVERDAISFWSSETVPWSYAPGHICDPPFAINNPGDGKRKGGNINGTWGGFSGNTYNSNIQAHEMGHNWGSGHWSGTMMDPTVPGGASSFGNGSINEMQALIPSLQCLDQCGDIAPVISVDADKRILCGSGTVNFTDASGPAPTGWDWTFEGGTPATSTDQNPTVTYNAAGTYDVTITVTNANGSTSLTLTDYITVSDGGTLSIMEGFEGTFPPTGWVINNPDNLLAFEQRTDAGNNSSSSMIMNNADNSVTGEVDEIILPPYDMTSVANPAFTFDVAYTTFDANSPDQLRVYASTDCGTTWTELWMKTHTDLETAVISTAQSNDWVPSTAADWRNETVDISSVTSGTSVMFKFHNTSGYGTRIWIDNLNIGEPQSVEELNSDKAIKIYPNPGKDVFTINLTLPDTEYLLEVTNALGQVVMNKSIVGNMIDYKTTLDLSKENNGVYIVSLTSSKTRTAKKLIKE